MEKVLKKAELPHCNPHSLRHTNLSLLVAAGVPMSTVIENIFIEEKEKKVVQKKNSDSDNSSEKIDINNFRKIKAEMEELGIDSIYEYFEYLEYVEAKNKKKNNSMVM